MEKRVNIEQAQPEAYKAIYGLAVVLSKSALSPIQKQLIKVRASQINSCSYCINMHTKEALKVGETPQRLFLLSAWKETDIFTEEEKALLALVESVTLIHQNGVPDPAFKNAEKFFSQQAIGDIIMATIMINTWNRIAVSTHLPIRN